MSRFLVVGTEDDSRAIDAIRDGLIRAGQSVTAGAVCSSSDLSSAILRAGGSKNFDAAIVLGTVEKGMESYVAQNIHNAAVAVFLPVVIQLGAVPDVNSIVKRALRVTTVGAPQPPAQPGVASINRPVPQTPSRTVPVASTLSSPQQQQQPPRQQAAGPKYSDGMGGLAKVSKDAFNDVSGGPNGAAGLYNADPETRKLIDLLNEHLIQHSGKGITGIGRRFEVVSRHGHKVISVKGFHRCLQEIGLAIPEEDIKKLFSYFDHDGSGNISYDEFLVGLRGELDDRRKAIVQQAFKVLDRDGKGYVDVASLLGRYDTTKHPEVISGQKKPEQVLRDFLDGFDGGNRDGKVTPLEFERYYATISASIDDDDYFELMMRNVWHISGGTGWTENTTNRRVLVTHRDGTQTVEEVPDDLAAGANVVLIKKALMNKGVDVVDIGMYGGQSDSIGALGLMGGGAPQSPLQAAGQALLNSSKSLAAYAPHQMQRPGRRVITSATGAQSSISLG